MFVCGSDQVFNPNRVIDEQQAFYMDFVPDINYKFSYAASFGKTEIPEEKNLIQEVVQFVDSLKAKLVPELNQINQANKATVGTFFSVRNPKQAMRSFGIFISTIDWKKSESLSELFSPFLYLGKEEKY